MTGNMQNTVLIALIVVVALFILYQYDSTLFGLLGRRYEGYADMKNGMPSKAKVPMAANNMSGAKGASLKNAKGQKETDEGYEDMGMNGCPEGQQKDVVGKCCEPGKMVEGKCAEGFADLSSFEGPSNFSSVQPPAGCYPRDQLTPSELLPLDQSSIYAQQNPMGPGSLKGKNFLSAGALIGVNTVGQSLRNANLQLRSEPPNPQVPVSIFLNSTITPDISHRPLEIGA
jgi:hypothetical protein